jgi:perosamine synthetase
MGAKRNIAIALPCLGEEEYQALKEPLESGWLTAGPKVAQFESAFASRHGVAHAVATTSCTTALEAAARALDIGPGDEVIVPAFTWVASANVIDHCGAKPVFADVDPGTYLLDPESVRKALSPRTKAVMAVHLFGLCCDMRALRSVIPNGIAIIEDAACAAGAAYAGQPAGSLGDIGCFSFHPRKTITTGEGGMATTNDSGLAARMQVLRNHGASVSEETRHAGPKPYLLPDFDVVGFNWRMTDLQAAVGLVQLGRLDGFIAERERWARWYIEALADLPWLQLPAVPPDCQHGWQAFVAVIDEDKAPMSRNSMMEILQDQGISTRPGTHAVTDLGAWSVRQGGVGSCPNATRLARQSIALPLHNRMGSEDYAWVAECLHALGR